MSESVLLSRGEQDAVEIGCTTWPQGAGRRFLTVEKLLEGDVIVHNDTEWVIHLVMDWSGTYESEASRRR